jgi:diguanylate cyclase (GGDEF)-like protein
VSFMTKHVILFTDAHEAPSFELIEALSEAGITTLIEGLREAEFSNEHPSRRPTGHNDDWNPPSPVAVLYEVMPGADMVELEAAVKHAVLTWPDAPLVACRRQSDGLASLRLRTIDPSTLRRLGFRAIADRPAQLAALLRELEEHGTSGEIEIPFEPEKTPPSNELSLPAGLKADRLRHAFSLVASLHFATDQKNAADIALCGLAPLIGADAWALYLASEKGSDDSVGLEPLASLHAPFPTEPVTTNFDWDSEMARHRLHSATASKAATMAVQTARTVRKTNKGQGAIAVPLIHGERVLGILEAVRAKPDRRGFSKADAALLDVLAVPLASAVANSVRIAQAERLSQTDDLTKLHNARYLRQFLVSEIRRARRYNSSITVVFLDLDNFKRVNDVHGHLVGSHVLMEMAAVVLSCVRDTDVVARYGGDEFVVVLPETGMQQSSQVAERVREKIEGHNFTGGRHLRLKMTASFGVAAFPQNASSPQQLIACADSAMYEAKAARKNCIRFAAAPAVEIAEIVVP